LPTTPNRKHRPQRLLMYALAVWTPYVSGFA